MDIQKKYAEFKEQCLLCTACTLAEKRLQVVVAQGPVPCELMFIGEAPGADEDEQGVPFVGRAGKLLTQLLGMVGLERGRDLYITNVCKCRPPENRPPEREEIHACIHWLHEQIELVRPKIIVLVGATAMRAILGDEEKRQITKERGKWFSYRGIATTIILHPSYLLRNPSLEVGKPKWITIEDLRAIKLKLEQEFVNAAV